MLSASLRQPSSERYRDFRGREATISHSRPLLFFCNRTRRSCRRRCQDVPNGPNRVRRERFLFWCLLLANELCKMVCSQRTEKCPLGTSAQGKCQGMDEIVFMKSGNFTDRQEGVRLYGHIRHVLNPGDGTNKKCGQGTSLARILVRCVCK